MTEARIYTAAQLATLRSWVWSMGFLSGVGFCAIVLFVHLWGQ